MPETAAYTFTHKEVLEALLKKQNINKGIWALSMKFGLKALNIGPTDSEVNPAALIAVLEIGLQKADKESSIAVNAAKVNPKPRKGKVIRKKK